jgi:chromosome segregation ATPase
MRLTRILQLTFLEWFEENADDIDTPPPTMSKTTPRGHKETHKDNDDNESISALQSAMLDTKNERKCAEADAQLLSNRLAHLRQEERRAQKRIDEANRRAQEIESVKKRNYEHQRAKQHMTEQMQREIRLACEANSTFVNCVHVAIYPMQL